MACIPGVFHAQAGRTKSDSPPRFPLAQYSLCGIQIPVIEGGGMRGNVHNTAVRFRANDALIAAAAEKAQREGMSLSELLRHAVRSVVREAA
jgi:hypothetical protein